MADKEVGTLTAAGALVGTELVHIVQSGNSRRTTLQDIGDLATIEIEDDGVLVGGGEYIRLNFAGAGVVVADAGGGEATITIAGGGGGSAITVQDNGSPLTTDVSLLNFVGFTVTEPVADQITITGGGGGNASGALVAVATYEGTGQTGADIPLTEGVDHYLLKGWIKSTTDAQELWMRVTDDGFTTVESGAGAYQYREDRRAANGGVFSDESSASATTIKICGLASGNGANEESHFTMEINHPETVGLMPRFTWVRDTLAGTGTHQHGDGSGLYQTAGAINGIRLFSQSGNVDYKFTLYKYVPTAITATEISIPIAISDETTDLTVGTNKLTYYMPRAFTITGIFACVTTAPTGASLIIDVNEGGTSIMTTNKLEIEAGENTTNTATTQPTLTDTAIAAGAALTFDIDQIGSTIAGAGAKVTLIGYWT